MLTRVAEIAVPMADISSHGGIISSDGGQAFGSLRQHGYHFCYWLHNGDLKQEGRKIVVDERIN